MTTALLGPSKPSTQPRPPHSDLRPTGGGGGVTRRPVQPAAVRDWPRTTRIGPWAVALFIGMLWLLPFNSISMHVQLPFELKLDRIVLPFVVVAWVLSLFMADKRRRSQLTPVHIAVGTFIAVEFMTDILNITVINRELLVNQALKTLVLLSSYAIFFVIVASVVRPSEVRVFIKFMLILASIAGLGALVEYQFRYNVFYQLTGSLLPKALFSIPPFDPNAVDELGRRMTMGPSGQPLELTTMMCLALPFALVGVMWAKERKEKIWYGLAACIMLSAGVASFRKSAFITPFAVCVVLFALSPRRAIRLLPGLPIVFVAIHLMAPGAIGSVFKELFGGQVGSVGTTTHRVAAYEFVRPYLWTNPAFGIGYGTYGANVNRIFDSQVLDTILDSGIVGLLTYLGMILTSLFTAVSIVRRHSRNSEVARMATALGAAAVAFFVSSFLYDAVGFPHGPYIFLAITGLIAVLYRGQSGNELPARALVPEEPPSPLSLSRLIRRKSTRALSVNLMPK